MHVRQITAELWAQIPRELHYEGDPTPWVQTTRPGERLHSFLEGPCFDQNGDLLVADVPYGRIFRIDRAGQWSLFHAYDGEPHSIKSDGGGGYYIADYGRGLVHIKSGGDIEPLASEFEAEPFLGLSDLCVAPNGEQWITDSGRTSLSDPRGRVLWRDVNGSMRLVLNNVPYPNGISLSPDGKYVYVAATRAQAVWRFRADDPSPQAPMIGVFAHLSGGLGPDGLAVATSGCLAVAQAQAGRAYVYTPMGDLLCQVTLPEGLWTTAVVFAAPPNEDLYILEAQTGSIYVAAYEAWSGEVCG